MGGTEFYVQSDKRGGAELQARVACARNKVTQKTELPPEGLDTWHLEKTAREALIAEENSLRECAWTN